MSKLQWEDIEKVIRIERYKKITQYDEIIKLGINTKWQNLKDSIKDGSDAVEVFDEELEDLQKMQYDMQLMNICCMCETWEQDLYNFLKEKNLIQQQSNDYGVVKTIFETAYPNCTISKYPKITEMRELVNAIKHGNGNSFNKLRQKTNDAILANSNIGRIESDGSIVREKAVKFDSNTLTSKTLKVEGKLKEYCDTITDFWTDVYSSQPVQINNQTSHNRRQ